jgi:cystathionine beta-lyase family protein involved in aluminum resistance
VNVPSHQQLLASVFGVQSGLCGLADSVERGLRTVFERFEATARHNQARVLAAFGAADVSSGHLSGSTGYGYHDLGRRRAAEVYARVFGAQSALVSPHILSGTHALSICLWAVLRPGDAVLPLGGAPYNTLEPVLGSRPATGSLAEFGIACRAPLPLSAGDEELAQALAAPVRAVYIQRSSGYSERTALSLEELATLVRRVRACAPHVAVLVDNCYGEFTECGEPGHCGADLVAGSLIKNPGGGLADGGGYIAGTSALVAAAAGRLSVPGQGDEIGAAPWGYRMILQGLFMAPSVVCSALKGAAFAAGLFGALGYATRPAALDPRSDIIQAIRLGSPSALRAFCTGIQKASPLDARAVPIPWEVPGYEHAVIMAGGTFVQGSSIELSADAPFVEPYTVYLQGGLSYHHVYCACLIAAAELLRAGELTGSFTSV